MAQTGQRAKFPLPISDAITKLNPTSDADALRNVSLNLKGDLSAGRKIVVIQDKKEESGGRDTKRPDNLAKRRIQ